MPVPDATRAPSYNGEMMIEGAAGENKMTAFLRSLPTITSLDDVRDIPAWREKDVDFLARQVDNTTLLVEVKTDRHIAISQKFCFELARVHHGGNTFFRPGWSVFSAATHVCVWCAPAGYVFMFTMADIRDGFRQYLRAVQQLPLTVVQTDRERTTLNVLVPLSYIQHTCYVKSFDRWILKKG